MTLESLDQYPRAGGNRHKDRLHFVKTTLLCVIFSNVTCHTISHYQYDNLYTNKLWSPRVLTMDFDTQSGHQGDTLLGELISTFVIIVAYNSGNTFKYLLFKR